MTKKFDCRMCGATLTGKTEDEVIEKIKQHNKEEHDVDKMSVADIDERKKLIEEV